MNGVEAAVSAAYSKTKARSAKYLPLLAEYKGKEGG